ncbi:MAG TPA: hypothetical protein VE944_24505 [Nostoc sp.]|uniref:hypothetical protein n=1 Tax=Nostoc sp. TaxID=1180 RepID=UPI002D3DCADB|nr:hypothetical protein [Nostoc sp.]HYX17458.1 hypothetical protein [Nostoc sp.]
MTEITYSSVNGSLVKFSLIVKAQLGHEIAIANFFMVGGRLCFLAECCVRNKAL